jgi:histidinol-phosphate aminotransferase
MPIFVAVDEAYIEFGGDSAVSLLDDHENLVVVRTFSKWAGLAGLRLGYMLADPGVASLVERIRPPYNVNSAAVVAAQATLDDLGGVLANVRRLVAERDRMQAALACLPHLEPVPGHGNFVLARVNGMSAEALVLALARRGILIQGFSDPVLASYVRITVGRLEQNDEVLRALRGVGGETGGASS